MAPEFVSAFLSSLKTVGETALRFGTIFAILIGATVIALILIWSTDRERFRERLSGLVDQARGLSGWGIWALGIAVVWLTLLAVPEIVSEQLEQELSVPHTTKEDPSAPAVYQYGPLAAVVEERTFTRTLTLPPNFLERIGDEGVQTLSPYLQDPSAENVTRLADTFRKSGQNVVFTREVTRLEETPLAFSSAVVSADLKFREQGSAARRSFYEATTVGEFRFKNGRDARARHRFRFSLPASNTVRNFTLTVNGADASEPDEAGNYQWEGDLDPGQEAVAKVQYVTQGGGSWRYAIGSGRRRIEAFQLTVRANESPRFLRGALYPTTRSGNEMTWSLKDVITSQQIDLFFPGRGSAREAEAKALSFLPLTLAGFLFTGWLSTRRVSQPLSSRAWGLAAVGFTFGLAAMVLSLRYMPLAFAVIVGAAVAAVLTARVAGRRLWGPALLCALLSMAFVSDLHSGVVVFAIAAAAFYHLSPSKAPNDLAGEGASEEASSAENKEGSPS